MTFERLLKNTSEPITRYCHIGQALGNLKENINANWMYTVSESQRATSLVP
jgi:hypothetical protein